MAVDFRSDQFSLGAMLYEMATGRRAFKKDTTPQTLAAIIEGEPVPVGTLSRRLPAALVTIIEQCLAKKPERRFASTRDLASALQAVPEPKPASGIGRRALWLAAAVVAVGLAGALLPKAGRVWRSLPFDRSEPAIRAIAVLPLQNLSGDPEQEYVADGMTEALITDLAKIRALKVIARSSAMRYKRTRTPLADVARELGVDAVVEGSCQRVGERVRVMVQLIDPTTERARWAESYDRDFSDLLALQSHVAQSIAIAIGATVTPEERERLIPRRPVAAEALEAYLKGMYHLQRFTPPDFETALLHFENALKIEPDYAPAHAGIAESGAPGCRPAWCRRARAARFDWPRCGGPSSSTAACRKPTWRSPSCGPGTNGTGWAAKRSSAARSSSTPRTPRPASSTHTS